MAAAAAIAAQAKAEVAKVHRTLVEKELKIKMELEKFLLEKKTAAVIA